MQRVIGVITEAGSSIVLEEVLGRTVEAQALVIGLTGTEQVIMVLQEVATALSRATACITVAMIETHLFMTTTAVYQHHSMPCHRVSPTGTIASAAT
jgi:hypothetical protein